MSLVGSSRVARERCSRRQGIIVPDIRPSCSDIMYQVTKGVWEIGNGKTGQRGRVGGRKAARRESVWVRKKEFCRAERVKLMLVAGSGTRVSGNFAPPSAAEGNAKGEVRQGTARHTPRTPRPDQSKNQTQTPPPLLLGVPQICGVGDRDMHTAQNCSRPGQAEQAGKARVAGGWWVCAWVVCGSGMYGGLESLWSVDGLGLWTYSIGLDLSWSAGGGEG